jgi:hypothetical protein
MKVNGVVGGWWSIDSLVRQFLAPIRIVAKLQVKNLHHDFEAES